jgi:hypothetical protein
MSLIVQPSSLTWVPVETAVANLPGQEVKSDGGAVQQHVDKDAVVLPFQAHFSHVQVRDGTRGTRLSTNRSPTL